MVLYWQNGKSISICSIKNSDESMWDMFGKIRHIFRAFCWGEATLLREIGWALETTTNSSEFLHFFVGFIGSFPGFSRNFFISKNPSISEAFRENPEPHRNKPKSPKKIPSVTFLIRQAIKTKVAKTRILDTYQKLNSNLQTNKTFRKKKFLSLLSAIFYKNSFLDNIAQRIETVRLLCNNRLSSSEKKTPVDSIWKIFFPDRWSILTKQWENCSWNENFSSYFSPIVCRGICNCVLYSILFYFIFVLKVSSAICLPKISDYPKKIPGSIHSNRRSQCH